MRLYRWTAWFAILTAVLLVPSSPGYCAFRPSVAVKAEGAAATLLVNGRPIARLRAENAGLGAAPRAEIAAERLRGAIERGLAPAAVGARKVGGAAAVVLGDEVLMVATPTEARLDHTRALPLAGQWVRRLRAALALPGLTLGRAGLVVPVGETRSVAIGGAATGPIEVAVGDERVGQAVVDLGRRSLVVRGSAPGSTTAQVSRAGAEVTVRIVVKRYAGQVTAPVRVDVTGRPAPAEVVAQAALDRCPSAVELEPGAWLKIADRPRVGRSLDPNATVEMALPVEMGGAGYLPRRASVSVQVRNRALPAREAEALLYSNDPEQVRRFGVLYSDRLEAGEAVRLLYHHQNRMPRAFYLSVDLVNPGERTAQVQVIEGAAKPIVDTVLVGHRAATRYMRHALEDVGIIVEVPAGERVTILAQRVAPWHTASGIYGIRPLSGSPLVVELAASREPSGRGARAAGQLALAPSHHVYSAPNKKIRAEYRVGGHWTFISVGSHPLDGRHPERHLEGEYGVFYDMQIEIVNPTSEESTVNLVVAPEAGGARGVFVIEGRFIELPPLNPPAEFILASFQIQPSSRGRVSVRTLPVGGSSYPVTLLVRTRRPGEPRLPALSFREGVAGLTETVKDEIPGN